MPNILNQIIEHKLLEIEAAKAACSTNQLNELVAQQSPPRGFLKAIQATPSVSLIAEVKMASPSKGLIREDFDPVAIARAYESAGATCVSVLTDEKFFQGKLEHLATIRQHVGLPLLRKDFVVDRYQVLEARAAGADAVLLIAECLTDEKLPELHDYIVSLGMTPLVELYRPENLESVLRCGAQLIGINNRNLETFETDLMHCIRLRQSIPTEKTVVGESGVFTQADVEKLSEADIDAMLVGESLMRKPDIEKAVAELLGTQKGC